MAALGASADKLEKKRKSLPKGKRTKSSLKKDTEPLSSTDGEEDRAKHAVAVTSGMAAGLQSARSAVAAAADLIGPEKRGELEGRIERATRGTHTKSEIGLKPMSKEELGQMVRTLEDVGERLQSEAEGRVEKIAGSFQRIGFFLPRHV